MVLPDTATQTYFAKLLEQAECYDDMDTYIKELGAMQQEWAVDDRNLTTVTCRSLQQAGQWPHSSEFIAKQVPGAQRGNERTFIRASCGKDDSDSYHMYGGFLPEATCSSRPRAGGACKKNLRKVPTPARSVAAGKASSRCCRGSNFNAEAEAMLPPRHKKTTAALTTASPTAEQLQQELRDEQQAKTAALKEVEQREHQQHEHQGKLEHQQQQQREQHQQPEPQEQQQQAQAQGPLSEKQYLDEDVTVQRLQSLLLQFPHAAMCGIHWHTLLRAYNDTYQDGLALDIGTNDSQKHLQHRLGAVLSLRAQARVDCQDGRVAIADDVALMPKYGAAATWPSVYRTLCLIVETLGSLEAEPRGDEGSSEKSLLLSQLRPVLQKIEDGELPSNVTGQMSDQLVSQLTPVSQLRNVSLSENGWSFRDEEGNMRKLQKIGHVVKAVLHWRDEHTAWRQSSNTEPSAIDKALEPSLQLVFSKYYNNLVLRLVNTQNETSHCTNNCQKEQAKVLQNDAQTSEQTLACTASNARAAKLFENPFKWSSPGQLCNFQHDSKSLAQAPCADGMQSHSLASHQSSDDHVEHSCLGRREHWSMSRGRSCSKTRRDASSQERAQSAAPDATVPRDRIESRGSSEPPKARWADIFDDPSDLFPEDVANPRAPVLQVPRTPMMQVQLAIQDAHVSAEKKLMCVNASLCESQQNSPLVQKASSSVPRGRSSARRGKAPRFEVRACSLTRDAVSPPESFQPRGRSEPPFVSMVDVFDDPFEPPPEVKQWSDVFGVEKPRETIQLAPSQHAVQGDVLCGRVGQSIAYCQGSFPTLHHGTSRVRASNKAKTSLLRARARSLTRDPALPAGVQILRSESEPPLTSSLDAVSPVVEVKPCWGLTQKVVHRPPRDKHMNNTVHAMSPEMRLQWPAPAWHDRSSICRGRTRSRGGAPSCAASACSPTRVLEVPVQIQQVRGKSAPAIARAADIFDDPFEPPPEVNHWKLLAGINHNSEFAEHRTGAQLSNHCSDSQQPSACITQQQQQQVLLTSERNLSNISRGRAPSCGRVPSCGARVCPSARDQAISEESCEPRGRSEPPHTRWTNVFDDPFEPPPMVAWAAVSWISPKSCNAQQVPNSYSKPEAELNTGLKFPELARAVELALL